MGLTRSAPQTTDVRLNGVADVVTLRTLSGSQLRGQVTTNGQTSAGDGAGSTYYWSSSSIATDNGDEIVKPNSIGSGSAGRWIKALSAGGESITALASIAALRALTTDISPPSGQSRYIKGRAAIADGGEGFFYYDASDTTSADNTGTIVVDAASRRWKRIVGSEKYLAIWFGTRTHTTINSAISAAASAGIRQVVPGDGTWNLTGPVVGASNIELIGSGWGTVLSVGANIQAITIGAISNFKVKNLRILGNRATWNTSSNHGIYAPSPGGFSSITIEDVWVDGVASAGIMFLASTTTHGSVVNIRRCKITDSGWHGIICQDYVDYAVIDNCTVETYGRLYNDGIGVTNGRNGIAPKVTNCRVDGAGALGTQPHGISMDSTIDRTIFTGNQVSNTVGYGIEIGFVTDGICDSNTIINCTRAAIALTGNGAVSTSKNTGLAIVGNEISGGSNQGIYSLMNSPSTTYHTIITISANTIRGVAQSGMELNYTKHFVCSNNTVADCGLSGIYVASSCDAFEMIGNKGYNNNTTANASHGGLRILTVAGAHTATVALNDFRNSGIADYYYTEDGARIDGRFRVGDTTPTVALDDAFFTANTGATSITNFDDGKTGQRITVRVADAFTTFVHNTSVLRLSGAANYAAANNTTISFVRVSGVWWEFARTTGL